VPAVGSNPGKLGHVIDVLRSLVARESLPKVTAAEPRSRRASLWRTLLARESLPEVSPPRTPPGRESLPSLLFAREQLPSPPPAAPRSQSFWAWITGRETLPEETEDVR
jgi:hypothetical protein